MKLLLTALVALAITLGLRGALAAEPAQPTAPLIAADDPFRPGPQHARLQKLVGTWDAVLVRTDAQGAEQRTSGTLTTVAHTGFHTLDTFRGEFMGAPYLGHGTNGYCSVRKQYFTFWTDSMTSSPMELYGDYDAEKRELVLQGECFGPSGKLEPCKTVTRYADDDHMTWALFGAAGGKDIQLLRIEYTRRR